MQSNRDRIKEMIEHISTFNDADPGEGISRFSYSENDAKARKYLIDICEEIGLKVRVDAVGNVFARLVGTCLLYTSQRCPSYDHRQLLPAER